MSSPYVAEALALVLNYYQSESQFNRKLTEGELYSQIVRCTLPPGSSKAAEGNGLLFLTAPELLAEYWRNNKPDLNHSHNPHPDKEVQSCPKECLLNSSFSLTLFKEANLLLEQDMSKTKWALDRLKQAHTTQTTH